MTGPATGLSGSGSTPALPVPAGPMDGEFIQRNQIIERYLAGRLNAKGAADFERFCRENPQFLDDIGMADRVQTGMELLIAIGQVEARPPARVSFFYKPKVVLWMLTIILGLGAALWLMVNQSAQRDETIRQMQKRWTERPLGLTTSTREIRLLPNRDGFSTTPDIVVGGGAAQLVDFRIDETRSSCKLFQVTIDRVNQGRVGVIGNLEKDTNGHLRIALNSTALGPGTYQLTIEGLSPCGGGAADTSWVTIGIEP